MRLDDFDPNINVEDQRGQGGSGFGGFGGGGGGLLFAFLPFIFNRFGCLGVAVVAGLFFLLSGGLHIGRQLRADQRYAARGRHRRQIELHDRRQLKGGLQRLQLGR